MKQIKILVVDDTPAFIELVCIILQELGTQPCLRAHSYDSGLAQYESSGPDLCLVDIDLGKDSKTGIELVEKIRETNATIPVIYLTAHYDEDFYEQTRHTFPSAFMNKELSRFKLRQAIDLAMMHKQESLPLLRNTAATESIPMVNNTQVFFKIGDVFKAFPVTEIAYFYADHKITFAHIGERNYPTSVQLKTLEDEFFDQFVRIHKSYLINFKFIESIQTKDNSVLVSGESLPLGYAYRKNFMNRLQILR